MLGQPGYHLLLCGPTDAWPADVAGPGVGWPQPLTVHRLSPQPAPGVLYDPDGTALRRLGLNPSGVAHYLIRPDGHVGYRAGGADLAGARAYLSRWLTRQPESADRPSE